MRGHSLGTGDSFKQYDHKLVKRILSFTKGHRVQLLLAILFLGISVSAELLSPIILQRTVDNYLIKEGTYSTADGNESTIQIPKEKSQGLLRNSLILLGLLIFTLVFSFLQILFITNSSLLTMKKIRMTLFSHLMRHNSSFHSVTPVGKLVSRITGDVETINEFFTNVLVSVIRDAAVIVGVVIVLFSLNPFLAGLSFAPVPILVLITILFRESARNAFRSVRKKISQLNTFLSEHIAGIKIIQMFVKEKRIFKKFSILSNQLMKASLGEMYVFAIFRPIIDLLSSISLAIIIYVSGYFLLSGITTLGTLIAFLNLIKKFYSPINDLSEKYTILQSAMAGAERVFKSLNSKDQLEEEENESPGQLTQDTPPFNTAISFEKVSFRYKEDEPVISNLNFTISPGETVALVGYTGSGKSTIARLLQRLWEPSQGSIYIGNKNLRDISLKSVRQNIIVVQQDVYIFQGSIMENIAFGKTSNESAVIKAAKITRAHEFIKELPDKYNTLLSEGGENLSSGQRQLIAFARAFVANPSIMILDEATSQIDTNTETLIQQGLEPLIANRTAIIIAHRLSTIRKADKIIVLDKGQVAEMGSHGDLMKKGGIYQALCNYQFGLVNI